MKMLLIHADLLEYWTTKPTKIAEPDFSDTTVERDDLPKVKQAADEIQKVMDWVKCKHVFIYPYAHLSENLSSPSEAIEVLNGLTKELNCERAPFGWYKRFNLHAKGHPMAELSRSI